MASNNAPGVQLQCTETTQSGKVVDVESQFPKTGDCSGVKTGLPDLSSSDVMNSGDSVVENVNGTGIGAMNTESSSESCSIVPDGTLNIAQWRFQVRLEKGQFTPALKDALLRDLNVFLYSSPCSSFTPSFRGSGLRFGVVWFSPENEPSYNWLLEKLHAINDKAGEYRFTIEPFAAHQNKICINIPWDSKEGLRDANVLKRIKFQNPSLSADRWKVFKTKTTESNKLIFCSIDDASLNILRKQNFRLNYGFNKVHVDVLLQRKPALSTKSSSTKRN